MFGEFKLLENSLGQGGYSSPSFWDNGFASSITDGLSKGWNNFSDFTTKYDKALGFGGKLLGGYMDWNQSNKMANMTKDYYNKMWSQQQRNNDREDAYDTNWATGFANSSYGK